MAAARRRGSPPANAERSEVRALPLARRTPESGQVPHVLGHWYRLFEDLWVSPHDFYAAVEAAVARRRMPGVTWSRALWHEGGFFSPQREYLRLRRGELVLDICGAPYGSAFFVSWWMGERRTGLWPFLLEIPGVGALAHILFRPHTHYAIDTALMFQEAVQGAVLEVIEALSESRGIRTLSRTERTPVLRGFFE